MRKIFKRLLLFMVLLVAVGMMLGASNAAEAKVKKLKTKTIKAGKSVNLKVKGEAAWKISNAKVARMTVLSTSKAKVTGLQKGTTRITAKVGKTQYKATIKVKGSPKKSGNSSNQVEGLSSSPISGSIDSAYYVNTGQEIVGHFDNAFANDIVAKTNSYRSSSGVGTLGGSNPLTEAAKTRAVESAVLFSHTRPNGQDYYTVGGTSGKSFKDSPVYGENLAHGFSNAGETMEAWIDSPSHYANLVRDTFVTIGVAVFWEKQSDGSYHAYIAQEFGA